MANKQYRVVFLGEIAAGHDPAAVRMEVGRLLRCNTSALERLFSGRPVVIRDRLDKAAAQKCKAAFERTGALCRVKAIAEPAPPAAVETAAAATMTCPKCGQAQPHAVSCAACGIYVEKFLQRQQQSIQESPADDGLYDESYAEAGAPVVAVQEVPTLRDNPGAFVKALFLPPATAGNPVVLGIKALVLIGLLIWGGRLALAPIASNIAGESVLHLINLPFHEAGHVLFRPLGRFMTSAGGSITQILVPLICLGVLLVQTRDGFGAGVCLWWTGENFLDLAPYINDARAGVMPLVGGNTGRTSPYGFHDWEFLLTETRLLHHDHTIARAAQVFGSLLMLLGLAWAGWILYRNFRAHPEEE